MKIIGINYLHSDSSCSLIINNEVVAAVEEERYRRIKHYSLFPYDSLKFCLEHANLKLDDIDYFCFNFNSKYNLHNKIKFVLKNPELLFTRFSSIQSRTINKSKFTEKLFKKLGIPKSKLKFVPHHLAHMSSAYHFSGFNDAITFSFDGTGDFSSVEIYHCNNDKFKLLEKINFPNSLGLFYQMITQYLGFKKYGDEFKVMSLASFGDLSYVSKLFEIFDIFKDNKFAIKKKYFNFVNCFKTNQNSEIIEYQDFFTKDFEKLIKLPPRSEDENLTQAHSNLAASAQFVFSVIALNLVRKYENLSKNICLTGGCAFNSVFCQTIKKKTRFKNVYVMPNSGDAGGGLGAAQYINFLKNKNFENKIFKNTFLGPSYQSEYIIKTLENDEIKKILNKNKIKFIKLDIEEIKKIAAQRINEGEIIFWFNGRSEFGPRALGNRSILANPLIKNIKEKINIEIKEREIFRPFAPAVNYEHKEKYFYTHKDMYNFMNFVVDVRQNAKELLPSVVHVNNTARAQVVSKENNKNFYELIEEFGKLSGHHVLLNTSLNIQEPICNSPEDVIKTFARSNIKNLFIENYHLYK